jgi:hypothetical protein
MEGRNSRSARITLVGVAVSAALAITSIAHAGDAAATDSEPTWSAGVESDFASRYEWRGLALSEGAVAQPEVWLSRGGFTLTLWSSLPISTRDPAGFHEFDPSLEYECEVAGWTITPTVELYSYPGVAGPSSAELEIEISRRVAGAVSAFAHQTVDIVAYSGAASGGYGLKRETDSKAPWSWSGAAHLDWDSGRLVEAYLGQPARTSQIAEASFAVTRRIGPAYLRAHVQADALLDRDLRSMTGDPTPISGGLALGAEW